MKKKWFSESEFTCSCCGEIFYGGMNPVLLRGLNILREEYGYPIYVSSGYRCEDYNEAIGGEPNSQHIIGNAADSYVDGDYQKFYDLVIKLKLFDGVGYYPNQEFIHVDCREYGQNPNYYRWDG